MQTSASWASRVVEDDEDRASVASVAYSTRSFADDVPRTPKRPFKIIDLERYVHKFPQKLFGTTKD